jgi:hypothetical protein
MPLCALKSFGRYVLFVAFLAVAFVFDPFSIDSSSRVETVLFPGQRVWPVEDRPGRGLVYSDVDIVTSLKHFQNQPAFAEPGVILRAKYPGVEYLSQFALQRQLYGLFVPSDATNLEYYVNLFMMSNAVALALVLGLFCYSVLEEFGWIVGLTVVCLIMLSDWLLAFSISLFYVISLRFLPFALCWYVLQRHQEHQPSMKLYIMLALSVMLASLCGYDYVTNIVVSCMLPAVYYGWRDGRPFGRAMVGGVWCALAGGAGLAAAVVMHAVALIVHFGSIKNALAVFVDRAQERMGLSALGSQMSDRYDEYASQALLKLPLIGQTLHDAIAGYLPYVRGMLRWIRYLFMDAVTVPLSGGNELAVPIVFFVLLVIVVAAYIYWPRSTENLWYTGRLNALVGVALLGFVVSNLWAIVFPGHMNHLHLNGIIFYLPFLLIAFTLVGVLIERAVSWAQNTVRTAAMSAR